MPRPSFVRQGRARAAALAAAFAALAALPGCDASENADLERGRALFVNKCGTCHALAEAGTSTQVGPDLDAAFARSRADGMDNDTIEGVVQSQIANPREVEKDAENYDRVFMPADIVVGEDAEDVAAYVASVAGVPGAKPPPLGLPAEVFTEKCGSCHALQAAGTSGTTGPDLDDVLAGKSAPYIEKQIVDPNSEITQGYQPNVMPADFGQVLAQDDALQKLVQYLVANAGKGG